MVEKPSKKQKKGFISETDISSLLQRYTANTVLALLQEVAQFPAVKLDWNALVKKTSTGISNAREYQMLWRHLAYRNALLEKLEDEAQPLDDDSDLEYELEAFPEINSEASTEAAACVKVLIASGLPSDSSLPNSSTVEAPLTINIPNSQSVRASADNSQPSCLMQGMNITVPVSVQKLPLPASVSTEVLDANGSISGNLPPRKKRKPWTSEEDIELISAVQKCGEGNWANILRGDFKWNRTASQLSQRWTILRKKHGNMILGSNSSGSQLSEAQLAARHAMSLALDMPVKNIAAPCTNSTAGTTANTTSNNSVTSTANAEALPAGGSFMPAQSQSQQGPIQTKSLPVGSPGSAAKSRVPFKKMPLKSNSCADSSIRAAAVAAGARIVTSSDAASLLKVAQGKNAIHIMPSGVSAIKSPIAGSSPAHLEPSSSLRNVRTSLPAAPPSSQPAVTSSASHPGLVKAASQKVQYNASSELSNSVISVPGGEHLLNPEVKAVEDIKVSDLGSVSGNEPSKEVQIDKTDLPKPEAELKDDQAVTKKCDSSSNIEMVENDQVHINGNKAEGNHKHDNEDKMIDSPVENSESQTAVEENCEFRSLKKEEADLPTMFTDKCSKNLEVSIETKASNH